jgi:anti-sigma regulatory factor (Ser/Thr protein kinase)
VSLAGSTTTDVPAHAFRHEALLYAGEDQFVERTLPFIAGGVDGGEPVLVVVGDRKIARLREALGADAHRVCFADMQDVGANPARIIPAWREFLDREGRDAPRARGIGEPIYAQRGSDELAECHRHEALLNLAFADEPGFWLVCPYDTEALDPEVVAEAHRTHPCVVAGRERVTSPVYQGIHAIASPFDEPLPPPPTTVPELSFRADTLSTVRRLVDGHGRAAGIDADRRDDLALAVTELCTNSIRHGGGSGGLRVWQDDGVLLCEVRDGGRIADPLVGRRRPDPGQLGGYGLWLANQVADLVQVRAVPGGSVIRLHMR